MNRGLKGQTNTFNALFIVTKGKLNVKIGGREMLNEEGKSYLKPGDVSLEF